MSERSDMFCGEPLVGTMSTFYPDTDNVRFELALVTAEKYRDAGIGLIAVDGSPRTDGDTVGDALRQRGVCVVRAEVGGIASQRQQGVRYAINNGAENVLGQEPEKTGLVDFADYLVHEMDDVDAAVYNGGVDILVVGRTDAGLASLPPVQRRTEHLSGWIFEEAFYMPPDALSGGRVFNETGAAILADYPALNGPEVWGINANNWIYLYETVLRARQAGEVAGGLLVDLIHPPEMTAEETDNPVFDRKRYDQFCLQMGYMLNRSDIIPRPKIVSMTRDVLTTVGKMEHVPKSDVKAAANMGRKFDNLARHLADEYGYQPCD